MRTYLLFFFFRLRFLLFSIHIINTFPVAPSQFTHKQLSVAVCAKKIILFIYVRLWLRYPLTAFHIFALHTRNHSFKAQRKHNDIMHIHLNATLQTAIDMIMAWYTLFASQDAILRKIISYSCCSCRCFDGNLIVIWNDKWCIQLLYSLYTDSYRKLLLHLRIYIDR